MAATTEEMESSADDLEATTGASTPNEEEDATYEDAGFAADKTGWKMVTSRKTKKKERAETAVQPSQQENQAAGSKVLVTAANHRPDQTTEDIICPNIMQNIMVASTLFRENADKYADVGAIQIAGKQYEVSAYEAAPSDTCKGVVRHIDAADDHRTIDSNIVNNRNPTALAAKRIKNSGLVIVVSDTDPLWYTATYIAGKWTYTTYAANSAIVRTFAPTRVTPDAGACKQCGGLHATADKVCTKRYLTPYVVRARRLRARLEQQDQAQQVEEDKQQTERGRSTSKTSTRSHSRYRSRSRTPARTSTTSRTRAGSRVFPV
ncbi:hypothetical protein HPB52_005450 [Rhipicephalus sanguineus]|uniref:Uncharacterized protein n=1 Tax=Rhipicephalus sanguineus TaxID=34632 RepID=A0A9D4Q4C6_RHISA|nr:hypothetical protein HPB52_005450 [Rhipicephalus sanguineus]